jgi:predicted glutamine amidotransferase
VLSDNRYATGVFAPTLYAAEFCDSAGRCLVSEPLDRESVAWHALPPSSFVTMTREALAIRPSQPEAAKLTLLWLS